MRKLTGTFIILIHTTLLIAQNLYQFDHLSIEDGLSQSTVVCIVKDKTGFMWFGTSDGLNKYNGYEFDVYRFDPYDSTSVSDNKIYSLYQDSDTVLWVGTRFGLNYYDRETDKFVRFYKNTDTNQNGLSGNFIRCINEDEDGNIWIGTIGAGLNKYVKDENKFYHYETPGVENNVTSIVNDPDGNLWIGTDARGLCYFNRTTEEFTYHSFNNKDQSASGKIYGQNLYQDNQNNVWVGTEGIGLYKFDIHEQRFTWFSHQDQNNVISNDIVKSIHEDDEGNLWIATDGGGLNIYNTKTEQTTQYIYDINDLNGISSDAVYTVYRDNEGIFWIGTFGGGINIINPNKKRFYHYTQEGWNKNSLSHKAVLSFCEDSSGIIWIGTDGGGLNRFDPKKERFTHFKHDPNKPGSISSNVITSIYEDSGHNLWVGTYSGGLNLFNRATGKFKTYKNNPDDPKSIINNNVWDILEDRNGNLWLGTLGGLDRFDAKNREFRHFVMKEDNSYFSRVISLFEDSKGRIWVGGNQLGLLNKSTGQIKIFPYKNELYDGTTTYDVRCIYEDKNGNLWIATEGAGLNLFDPENGKFTAFTTKDGLSNNSIHQILEDKSGNLWLSTNNGLTRFSPETKKVRIYDDNDGLQSNQFSYMAAMKDKSGRMYFGGLNGFNVFHPDSIHDNPYKPPVVLTDFIHFNAKENKNAVLNKHIHYAESIELPFKSVFTLQFTALNYTSTEKNQYKYKLEGFSDEWINAGNQRTATYTNLDPGKYVFHVKGSNNDLVWNDNGTQLDIIISPPWWKTKAAYVLYIVLIILIFYSFRSYLIGQQKMKNDLIIKDLETKKIEEVNQMKLRFFTNISHEFRTPLTLIMGPIENLMQNQKIDRHVKRQLRLMASNAERLFRLVNQLMDFRKIETGNMQLRASRDNIVDFLKEIKDAFNDFAKKHRINYQFISSMDKIQMYYDHDKMDKVFYNLLSNAFKFTPDNGKISILVNLVNKNERDNHRQYAEIIVQDTGIGISADRLPNVFDRFYQIGDSKKLKRSIEQEGTGIGLALSKELIELHHGNIEVQSMEGLGTKFIIHLPVDASHLAPEQIVHQPKEQSYMHNQLYKFLSVDEVTEQETEQQLDKKPDGDMPAPEKILLVDDNHEVREFLRVSLEPEYDVIEAEDGLAGLKMAKEEVPDLIINDIMMPGMDGVELTEKLKTDDITCHIPVILLTAKNTVEFKIKGLEIGADDYICKPFNVKLLKIRIRNLIDSRKMLQQKFRKDILLEPKEVTVTSSDEKFLTRAMEVVENHISDSNFSVMVFVKEMGMSRSVMYRKLEAVTGQSVNEFIRTIRLKRAAQLLSLNEFTISEVTYEVGFNDPQYFSKCFSKQFGKTPSAYAAENKKEKKVNHPSN